MHLIHSSESSITIHKMLFLCFAIMELRLADVSESPKTLHTERMYSKPWAGFLLTRLRFSNTLFLRRLQNSDLVRRVSAIRGIRTAAQS